MFPNFGIGQLQGVDDRRAPTLIPMDGTHVPSVFPMQLWMLQQSRYYDYWRWFNGDVLNEVKGRTKKGEDILKYPLGLNPIRGFARKHAAVLLGERGTEKSNLLIHTRAKPQESIESSDAEFSPEDKKLARLTENIVNSVWSDSGGAAIQTENAVLSQFLGGHVFQVSWRPDLKSQYRIPIKIDNIIPDFFLPIWASNDPWNLLEAYVIYRLPQYVAQTVYGYENQGGTAANSAQYVTYCEHWTRSYYSITLNGSPLTSNYYGPMVTYDHVVNPYGFVPFVYIPHMREGNFYGSSHVEDLRGLTREINARTADFGDAIRDTVHRKRFVTDVAQSPRPVQLDSGLWAVDLGRTNVTTKATPKITIEDPPTLSEGLTGFSNDVWSFLLREGSMGDVAYGEDEGSQRSALTLAFRMWPVTSHIQMERAYWDAGLSRMAQMITEIARIKKRFIPALESNIPADFPRRIQFYQDFLPMIPRDREQLVNEVILRFQAGLIGPWRAIEMLGDVSYIKQEVDEIQEWLTFKASLETTTLSGSSPKSSDQAGAGAPTQTTAPTASSGTSYSD